MMVDLSPYELQRKEELQKKLRMRVLTVNEANELSQILEKEKLQATSTGDWKTALGIILLLGIVYAFLKEK